MCVWDVEGVGVVSIGSELRVCAASRPAGPSLATKSRIYEGGRPEPPLFSSPQTGTSDPEETSDQLVISHLF